MDDGSTDGTSEIIKGINDSQVKSWSVNWGGPAQSRNRDEKAKGNLLRFWIQMIGGQKQN